MKKYCYLVLPALFLLAACGRETPALTGLWEFSQGTGEAHTNCFLNLGRDGHYTLYIPYYFDYGTWRREGNDSQLLQLHSQREATHYYGHDFTITIGKGNREEIAVDFGLSRQIESADMNGEFGYDMVYVKTRADIKLKRAEVQYPDTLDPFGIALNRWRITAERPEDCLTISYRTINYIKHMYALFRGQYAAKADKYDYRFSPSPLLYGKNGIATINFSELPKEWTRTFYDAGQARQSCAMLYALFDEPLEIPKGYQRVDELWSSLLGQMLQYALRKDFCSPGAIDTAAVQ